MLTLHKTPESIEIAKLYESENDRKPQSVYWHPTKELKYKMGVSDVKSFLDSEKFRDYYKLSVLEAQAISEALHRGKDVPEGKKGIQNKFFKVKMDLEKRLYTEMDIGDSQQFLRVDFPDDKSEWSGLHITIGSSGSGKTFHSVDLIKENLRGPRRNRRQFVYASTELNKDRTLKDLMKDKFRPWVQGIDMSDDAYKDSEKGSPEEWFKATMLPILSTVPPGGHIVLDDPKDCEAAPWLMRWQNQAYRTLRHQGVGLTSIQHSMRGGRWSSQAYSSVKYVHTFPRGSGKGKLIDYLSKDIGTTLKEAREYVQRFAEQGRVMTVRMHSPAALIGPKGIVLL